MRRCGVWRRCGLPGSGATVISTATARGATTSSTTRPAGGLSASPILSSCRFSNSLRRKIHRAVRRVYPLRRLRIPKAKAKDRSPPAAQQMHLNPLPFYAAERRPVCGQGTQPEEKTNHQSPAGITAKKMAMHAFAQAHFIIDVSTRMAHLCLPFAPHASGRFGDRTLWTVPSGKFG